MSPGYFISYFMFLATSSNSSFVSSWRFLKKSISYNSGTISSKSLSPLFSIGFFNEVITSVNLSWLSQSIILKLSYSFYMFDFLSLIVLVMFSIWIAAIPKKSWRTLYISKWSISTWFLAFIISNSLIVQACVKCLESILKPVFASAYATAVWCRLATLWSFYCWAFRSVEI